FLWLWRLFLEFAMLDLSRLALDLLIAGEVCPALSQAFRSPASLRVKVKPIVFFGGQRQQRFFERPLDRTQNLPTRLFFFRALLFLDQAQHFAFKDREFLGKSVESGVLNNATSGAGRKIQVRGINQPLQVATGPRRVV